MAFKAIRRLWPVPWEIFVCAVCLALPCPFVYSVRSFVSFHAFFFLLLIRNLILGLGTK